MFPRYTHDFPVPIPLISPYFPGFCSSDCCFLDFVYSSDCFWHNSCVCFISFVVIIVNTMS